MLSQLLDHDIYAKLNDRELELVSAVIDAELIKNPEIQKLLKQKVDAFIPRIVNKKGGG